MEQFIYEEADAAYIQAGYDHDKNTVSNPLVNHIINTEKTIFVEIDRRLRKPLNTEVHVTSTNNDVDRQIRVAVAITDKTDRIIYTQLELVLNAGHITFSIDPKYLEISNTVHYFAFPIVDVSELEVFLEVYRLEE